MDRNQVLLHQNSKLGAQLEEKRREHRVLQDKLAGFEGREAEYAQTLLCVNRLWAELAQDLHHLCAAAALQPLATADENGSGGPGAVAGSGHAPSAACAPAAKLPASITDPFLRQLLAGADARTIKDVADGCKQLEREQTEVEAHLVARTHSTKGQLASLLQHIEHLQQQQPGGKEQNEVARLQALLNKQAAQHRTLSSQVQLADDRWLEGQEQIKKLQNELADAEQELSNFQRKLHSIKTSNELAAREAAAATPQQAPAPPTPSGSLQPNASLTPAPSLPVQEDVADEVKELQQLLNKRTEELDKECKLHMDTRRCVHACVCACRGVYKLLRMRACVEVVRLRRAE